MSKLELLCKIKLDLGDELAGLYGISTPTQFYEQRVVGFSDIIRQIAAQPGQFRAASFSIDLDNSGNYFSDLKRRTPFKNRTVEILLGNLGVNIADFAAIATGKIQNWSAGKDVFSLEVEDLTLKRFDQPVSMPISKDLFPNLPSTTPANLVPLVIGKVQATGGALPAYLIDAPTIVLDTWTSRSASSAKTWTAITWAAELSLFVAVAATGGTGGVMTSPDGITWTGRTQAVANAWQGVVWSKELTLLVAVSDSGVGNRVMTSPDGITWTSRTSAEDNSWNGVTWSAEKSLFVAVSSNGTNRVMTSPDGITWTARSAPAEQWTSVTWSPELGLFCAVASQAGGTGNGVMTSPDGITWTGRTAPTKWQSVVWSPELKLFCAVGGIGTGDRIMTSLDGLNWTLRKNSTDNNWIGVAWSPELRLFAAVGHTAGDKVLTSPDGINWTEHNSAANNTWQEIAWSPTLGIFAGVSRDGTNRVQTSSIQPKLKYISAKGNVGISTVYQYGAALPTSVYTVQQEIFGGLTFTTIKITFDPRDSERSNEFEITWDSDGNWNGAAITNPARIYEQLLLEEGFVAGDLDSASFTKSANRLNALVITGGFAVVNANETLRGLAEKFAESFNLTTFVSGAGKVAITIHDQGAGATPTPVAIDESQVAEQRFGMLGSEENASSIVYEFAPNFVLDEFTDSGELKNSRERVNLGEEIKKSLSLWYVRDAASALVVAQSHLFFLKEARTVVALDVDPALIKSISIGDDIHLTHFGGLGKTGFSKALFHVLGAGLGWDGVSMVGRLQLVDLLNPLASGGTKHKAVADEEPDIWSDADVQVGVGL